MKSKKLFKTVAAVMLGLCSASMADSVIGFNVSGEWETPHIAGELVDGFTGWTDSGANASGSTILEGSGGAVNCEFSSANLWWAGPEDTSEEQLYRIYLDDGGDGASITLSGLSSWLASEGLGLYEIRVYQNTDNGIIFTPIDIIENGTVIDTVQASDIWGFDNSTTLQAKVDTSLLAADTITIKPQTRNLEAGIRSTISGIKITGLSEYIAYSPSPFEGETATTDQTMEWQQVPQAAGSDAYYEVYFGKSRFEYSQDPNDEPNTVDPDYYLANLVKTTTPEASDFFYTPAVELENSTTYYWRVDAVVPGNPATVYEGREWSFVTAPPSAVVTVEPKGKTVKAGTASVDLTLTALNTTSYQWYKDGIALVDDPADEHYSGETSATLTLYDVELEDEGYYYCICDNSLEQPTTSKTAQVMVQRMIGWWKLDNDLTDSVNEVVAEVESHDGSATSAGFDVNGKDGAAYICTGEIDNIVTITESVDYFNCYAQGYTVSVWAKFPGVDVWGAMVSKQEDDHGKGFIISHTGAGQADQTLREVYNDVIGGPAIDNDQWHSIVATYDPETHVGKLYVDGLFVNQSYNNKSAQGSTSDLIFGAELVDGSVPFIGLLDDVRMWNYPLDANAAALLYTDFNPGVEICVERPQFDLTGPEDASDCKVDIYDFAAMAQQWLECNVAPTCIQ